MRSYSLRVSPDPSDTWTDAQRARHPLTAMYVPVPQTPAGCWQSSARPSLLILDLPGETAPPRRHRFTFQGS